MENYYYQILFDNNNILVLFLLFYDNFLELNEMIEILNSVEYKEVMVNKNILKKFIQF